MRARALLLASLLLALGAPGVPGIPGALVAPAEAATRTVRLTADGPSPARLSLKPGDRVQFRNDDNVPHEVESEGSWQFDSGPIAPGDTSIETMVLTAPGTYRYTDTRGIVVLPQTFRGALVVPAAPPPPTATPSPTASPTPSRTASPTPSPSASPTASPTPTPTATPTPPPGPTATASAAPLPTESPSPPPSPAPDIRYGDPQALVQGSPHRYGLPALLGLVALAGVASLLGRYLLSLAPRRS